jgi:hypothetical protein
MLEGEHCCEGVTGAAAIDVILNGEKPADPTQIAGKFTGGDAGVAADAWRAKRALHDEDRDSAKSVLSHVASARDVESRPRV